MMIILFVWLLVGCSRENEQKMVNTSESAAVLTQDVLPANCVMIDTILKQCKSVVKSKNEVKKMLAVIDEQIQAASKAEQISMCRDVLAFWQAVCGVAQ